MRILVTGGAGFIGSASVLHLIELGHEVTVFDALTYAAAPGTVEQLKSQPGCTLIQGDIRDREALEAAFEQARPGAVMHMAAETHVDRSIDSAGVFIETNVTGTYNVLQAVRAWRDRLDAGQADLLRLLHISTDEVFGELGPHGLFNEESAYAPNSPYAASKAASDHLVRAWGRTYGLDIRISNCSNNYGPRQFPEKLIPLMVLNAIEGRSLPVYGDGGQVRDWLHVEDHARALAMILTGGAPGETYCIGGNAERTNLEVIEAICSTLDRLQPADRPYRELIGFVDDRPGHDRRYAIDARKIARDLDWVPRHRFEQGLEATIRWYLDNRAWWEPLTGRYGRERLGTAS